MGDPGHGGLKASGEAGGRGDGAGLWGQRTVPREGGRNAVPTMWKGWRGTAGG